MVGTGPFLLEITRIGDKDFIGCRGDPTFPWIGRVMDFDLAELRNATVQRDAVQGEMSRGERGKLTHGDAGSQRNNMIPER